MFKTVEPNPNFPELERKLLEHWYKNGIVKKYLLKNKDSKKTFSFLDGPITANNPMGVHHAWGRSFKDLWPKFFNLLGYKQRFQNGFDCQGLWVEVEVEKELKLRSKKDIENLVPGDAKASIAKFVQLCKDRVIKFSNIQTEQSKRLGYFADWDNSYFTMSDENNYMIWYFLKTCYDNGWIYKGRESVPWCPRCETAISQHEMLTEDYKEVVHESVYFKLKINPFDKLRINTEQSRSNKNSKLKIDEYLLVWTTTPWTIPANIAVAVDVDLEYSLVEDNAGNNLWIAKKSIERVLKENYKRMIKTVKGKELVGLKYEGPFDGLPTVAKIAKENKEKFHTVIPTDSKILPISTEEGTGMVHTAVSAGVEDFKLGKKLGLPMIPVIADNADYLTGLDFLSGKNAKKHPRLILDYMEKNGWVFNIHNYKHRYPACWRCKAELVWKVEDEWYIAMDVRPIQIKNLTLRERMIEVAKKIKWMPEFGLDRELDWLKNMHDWLISKKNRYWGLALPIYECKKCGKFEVIGSKAELKNRTVSGWDKFEGHTPHKPYIDEVKIKCSNCHADVERINDVGNPWLDAGIVPYSTISENNKGEPLYFKDKKQWKDWFPADFITESFPGQFKNWFYAMIAMSSVLENTNPYKTVLGFATMLGEDGRPMHKSWGNYIEFNEGAEKIGVDVMRWLYASHNPAENLLFGYKKADEKRRQFYLMLWNVYKFFIEYANLEKFKVTSDELRVTSLKNILDKWIISKLQWLIQSVEDNLRQYNIKDTTAAAEQFVSDLSTWYIRRSRDRIWINSENTEDKTDFYNTLYYVLQNLAIILSPIMPFITEEIFVNLTGEESVHLSSWPKIDKKDIDEKLISDMELVREIVEVGHRIRKEQKLKVRQPLAKILITLPKNRNFLKKDYFDNYLLLIKGELNIKDVQLENGSSIDEIKVAYDTVLTKELIKEGQLRELIRSIQGERKRLGKKPTDFINISIPNEFVSDIEFIKKRVLAKKINCNGVFKIE